MHCQKWSLASALLQVHHYFPTGEKKTKLMVVVMHKSKFVKSVWCQRWSSCVFNQSRNGEQAFDRNRWVSFPKFQWREFFLLRHCNWSQVGLRSNLQLQSLFIVDIIINDIAAGNSLCRLARNVTLCKYWVFSKIFSLSESEKKNLTHSHSLLFSLTLTVTCRSTCATRPLYTDVQNSYIFNTVITVRPSCYIPWHLRGLSTVHDYSLQTQSNGPVLSSAGALSLSQRQQCGTHYLPN